MRRIVLLLLVIVGGGCATSPHEATHAGRWHVIPLDPGDQAGNSRALLLDSQTGDTWISSFGSNSWSKLSK